MRQFLSRFFSERKLLIAIVLLGLISCGPDKQMVINEKVSERVNSFRAKKLKECQASLLQEAEKIADSLLLEEAERELNDSLIRMRPFKPVQPPPLLPIDTLKVSPLFFVPASSTQQQK